MPLYRIELDVESEAELEVAVADGRWKPELVVIDTVQSKHVQTVTINDPDTGLPVEVEIRKLETGPMIGLDGSYLAQLCDGENPLSPYDPDTVIDVPDDEGAQEALAEKFIQAGYGNVKVPHSDLKILGINEVPDSIGSWQEYCEFVYKYMTGEDCPPTTARGRGFRSQHYGKKVAEAIRAGVRRRK